MQAFAGAVKAAYPNHLRLSIHQSTGEHKISLSLLNTKTGFTTPWHCSVALMATGEWLSAPKGDLEQDTTLSVVEENGRPSFSDKKLLPRSRRTKRHRSLCLLACSLRVSLVKSKPTSVSLRAMTTSSEYGQARAVALLRQRSPIRVKTLQSMFLRRLTR